MRNAGFMAARPTKATDLGTLWTLKRDDSVARCGLVAFGNIYEISVSVDGALLLSQRFELRQEVFSTAERWRVRMSERGWKKVTVAVKRRPDRRRVN
jgi:hypothetical protein